jgi:hypothetical protein
MFRDASKATSLLQLGVVFVAQSAEGAATPGLRVNRDFRDSIRMMQPPSARMTNTCTGPRHRKADRALCVDYRLAGFIAAWYKVLRRGQSLRA